MGLRRAGHIALILVAASLWMHAAAVPAAPASLVVYEDEPWRKVASVPIESGMEIELSFINSIYRAPVKETLVYEAGRGIFLTRVESPSAGVFEYYGLMPDGGGNGAGVATLKRRVGEIRLRSYDYEHHRLAVGGSTIRLKGIIEDGKPAIVRVEPDTQQRR